MALDWLPKIELEQSGYGAIVGAVVTGFFTFLGQRLNAIHRNRSERQVEAWRRREEVHKETLGERKAAIDERAANFKSLIEICVQLRADVTTLRADLEEERAMRRAAEHEVDALRTEIGRMQVAMRAAGVVWPTATA